MATKISDHTYEFATSNKSVSSEYAKDTSITPGTICDEIFGVHKNRYKASQPQPRKSRQPATAEDLERAAQCGKWGDTKPSELFMRIYHDAVVSLDSDPLMGCVSPSLMGSYGTIPLTIIAPLHDICRHMSNLIARAEKEVFLATNYWMDSEASKLITHALKELSRRAVADNRRVVVKIIYDRGHLRQAIENRIVVPEKEYTGVNVRLPAPDEIPHVSLQVMNYHRLLLGTFHPKFMVVDRKLAIIQSNNIQDNDNLEMMTHVEGPIVDSFYDLALVSWDKALEPPLPCATELAAEKEPPCFSDKEFDDLVSLQHELKDLDNWSKGKARPPEHLVEDPHFDDTMADEIRRVQGAWSPTDSEDRMQVYAKQLNRSTHLTTTATAPQHEIGHEMLPYVPTPNRTLFPIALVNRKPWGAPNHSCVVNPQNEAWLSAIRNAKTEVFIQSPDVNAEPLLPELLDAARRGVEVTYFACLGYNDSGELLPMQGGTNEMVAAKLYSELKDEEHRKKLRVHYYVGKDQVRPIHNRYKTRSCHIKLLIADRHIGIQGNGNQDTQSWYHSQEANILIDSHEICEAWLEGIRRNQNTFEYGKASQEDGIWRDEHGKEVEGALGKDPGRFAWAKGVKGVIARARGVGGF